MLKKMAHEAILLTFSGMKPVYSVSIKFILHLVQIRKVAAAKTIFAKSSSRTTLLK